jgi:hypothetical protein
MTSPPPRFFSVLRRAGWSLLGVVGFLLSPLSWWNDLWVNLPLAYGAATLVHAVWPAAFIPALAVAYWATNILGLVLLQIGAVGAVQGRPVRFTKVELRHWALWSLLYTVLILALCLAGVLRPWPEYEF